MYVIAQKGNDDLWQYEIIGVSKPKSPFYIWDDLIIAAYKDIADIQKAH
jgi:hypothetical protein